MVNAAGIFIVRTDGMVLICHPTNHAPNVWSIPKGKIEGGESMLEAAIRETYEETNIYLSGCRYFDVHVLDSQKYKHGKKKLWPFLFLENSESEMNWMMQNSDIRCNSSVPEDRGGFLEMDDYRWTTLDEARELLHHTQVACIDKIEEIINNK